MTCPNPDTCPCDCHNGWQRPCSLPGGCGLGAPDTTCQARPCQVCQQPAHDLGSVCPPRTCTVRTINLGHACRRCHDRLVAYLTELPELYALAAGELNSVTAGGGNRGSEPSLGLRVAALDLRNGVDVIETLVAWDNRLADHFAEDTIDWTPRTWHRSDPTGHTLVEICRDLRADMHRACATYPRIDELARDLGRLVSEARQAARTGQRHTTVVDCPADREDGTCGARLTITGLDLTDVVWCKRCSSSWEVQRLLLVAASDQAAGVWLPDDDVALLVGVRPRTLRRWAKEGRVQRSNGLYELNSVRDAIRDGGRHAAGA